MNSPFTTLNDFQVLKTLGEGSFGSVYKVRRKTDNQMYALQKVKMAKLSTKQRENALNEVRILASITCPYIIAYQQAFLDDSSSSLCIIMEFAENGDLLGQLEQFKKKKQQFEQETLWRYSAQILIALNQLHQMKILHRDLQCANVFLNNDSREIRIGDLNVSKVAQSNLVYTQTGTPYYASPEVWKGEAYDYQSDIWSLGCVIYELAAQTPPFTGGSMQELYRRIVRGTYERLPYCYSDEFNNFIAGCLKTNPRLRSSITDLVNFKQIKSYLEDHGESIESIKNDRKDSASLLQTIKLPNGGLFNKNLILPKPQYDDIFQPYLEPNRPNSAAAFPPQQSQNEKGSYNYVENGTPRNGGGGGGGDYNKENVDRHNRVNSALPALKRIQSDCAVKNPISGAPSSQQNYQQEKKFEPSQGSKRPPNIPLYNAPSNYDNQYNQRRENQGAALQRGGMQALGIQKQSDMLPPAPNSQPQRNRKNLY